MMKPPSAQNLQDIVIFNIIYYTGRRGQENLRKNDQGYIQDLKRS